MHLRACPISFPVTALVCDPKCPEFNGNSKKFFDKAGARGPVSVGFSGARQLSLFGGEGGSSQRAVSTFPPKLKARPPHLHTLTLCRSQPIIFETQPTDFGLRASFRIPTAATNADTWYHTDGSTHFINLPEHNWSEFYPLITTWQKLAIQGEIRRGLTSVYVDVTDVTYATSNGQYSSMLSWDYMKWGVTSDCRNSVFCASPPDRATA